MSFPSGSAATCFILSVHICSRWLYHSSERTRSRAFGWRCGPPAWFFLPHTFWHSDSGERLPDDDDPAHALDGGIPCLLHIGRHWPAASDEHRSATKTHVWQNG